MIVVVGATGLLGGTVCALLRAAGAPARAVVRGSSSTDKVSRLDGLGMEVVEADLRRPETLDAACAGADAVICTVSSMPFAYEPGVNDIETTDLTGVCNLVDAAARSGVGRFVHTSMSRQLDLDFPLGRAKRAAEQHLIDSGLEYTILRPSFFMEIWLSPAVGFDPSNGTVTVYGDGTAPVSYIAVPDVAAFAVQSLTASAARNAVLELGGPEAISQLDAKAAFEAALGRPVDTQQVPVTALQEQLAAATDGMQQSFVSLMICLARGDAIDMEDIQSDFGVALTSVKEYALAQVP